MTRAKLLATSILASTALLGATAATQAASPGPQQVAVDQGTPGSAAQSEQAAKTNPHLVTQNGSDDRDGDVEDDGSDRNGVEDNDDNGRNGAEDNDHDDRSDAEDDDRNDHGQTGEHEGEHED